MTNTKILLDEPHKKIIAYDDGSILVRQGPTDYCAISPEEFKLIQEHYKEKMCPPRSK